MGSESMDANGERVDLVARFDLHPAPRDADGWRVHNRDQLRVPDDRAAAFLDAVRVYAETNGVPLEVACGVLMDGADAVRDMPPEWPEGRA